MPRPDRNNGRPLPTLSAEATLVCLCARTRISDGHADRIRTAASSDVNWQSVLDIAGGNGVLPLLGYSLRTFAAEVIPESVSQSLASHCRQATFKSMRLTGELLNVTNALTAASIPAISFKGATLGALAYGNVGLRPFGDLDILVKPTDVAAAVGVLKSLGFPGWEADRDVELHLKGECEETFIRHDGKLTVDLHWGLSRGYLPFDVPFDDLWKRAQPVRVGGGEVPTLAGDDLLPFLCLHGGKHQWERLQWVCDIAELLRAQPGIDVERALSEAIASGRSRVLLLGLDLAHTLLDLPVPVTVEKAIAADRVVAKLAEERTRAMFRIQDIQPETSPLKKQCEASLFHLRMQRRLRDKLRYLTQAAVPNPRDRGVFSLPPMLHFLHFFTRPFRLFKRYVMAGV